MIKHQANIGQPRGAEMQGVTSTIFFFADPEPLALETMYCELSLLLIIYPATLEPLGLSVQNVPAGGGLAEPAITAKVDVQPVEAILGPLKSCDNTFT